MYSIQDLIGNPAVDAIELDTPELDAQTIREINQWTDEHTAPLSELELQALFERSMHHVER